VKKTPDPIDRHVGSRVRMQRVLLKMSQEKLGEALGLTFQQIQKYEKGTNRIGASRLQQISKSLNVPPSFFFEGAPTSGDGATGFAEESSSQFVVDFLSTRSTIARFSKTNVSAITA
jgi:transcriptional regulator with XRE-family HTH domain